MINRAHTDNDSFWTYPKIGASQIKEFEHSLAVVIGINDYINDIPPLSNAVNDATRLANHLCNDHGYQVHLLVQNVTRDRLIELFTVQLPNQVTKKDRLLIYFAGHGIALEGDDGPAGYLIPQDAKLENVTTFLSMTDLHTKWMTLECRHLLAILDCCFAGAFRWAGLRQLRPLPEIIYKERYARFIRDRAWQVLTSAAHDQQALDSLPTDFRKKRGEDGQHSPFALALFDALAGKADLVPKDKKDGVITATELYLYLRDTVEIKATEHVYHRQTPGLWPLKNHDKGEYIFLSPGYKVNLPPAPPLTKDNNPYRGLQAYEYNKEHAKLFFGRVRLTDELVEKVTAQALTVVVGASGTGKSSLVKAGLLPKLLPLDVDIQQASRSWHVLTPIRLTESPTRALQHLLSMELSDKESSIGVDEHKSKADVHTSPLTFATDLQLINNSIMQWCASHSERYLVLVIDQFEELVSLCRNEQERTDFLQLLAELLNRYSNNLRLILTLRSDFEPQFAESPLGAYWKGARFVLTSMNQNELRQVIEGPAAERVLYFEQDEQGRDLVDQLINELVQMPGALPLLSFTLSELYLKYLDRQQQAQPTGDIIDRSLAWEDYHTLGGVVGSLSKRSSEEYTHLPDDAYRATMQRVILRMIALEGNELARRRVPLAELEYLNNEENARVTEVLRRLVDARLLIRGQSDIDGDGIDESYVEPAHDTLINAWDRLLMWKREAEEYLPLQRRLAQAATEWSRASKKEKTSLLWNSNPRLPQLEAILWLPNWNRKGLSSQIQSIKQQFWPEVELPQKVTWLNLSETKFVAESVQRRAYVSKIIAGGTLAAFAILAGLSLFAEGQRKTAVAEANARTTEVVVRSTAQANAILARETAVAEANARATAAAKEAAAAATAISAEATAVSDRNEAARQARLATSRQLAAQSEMQLTVNYELALLLAIEAGRKANTFEADTALRTSLHHRGRTFGLCLGHQGTVNYVQLNPNGMRFVTASSDGTAQIWDAQTCDKTQTLAGHAGAVWQATWDSTGTRIVTVGEDGMARVWDVATGDELVKLVAPKPLLLFPPPRIDYAAWDPTGKRIVTACENGMIYVWDAQQGKRLLTLKGHTLTVSFASWNPDGRYIATASEDGTARIWNAENGDTVAILRGHIFSGKSFPVRIAAWNPDGIRILTTGTDGSVVVWNAQSGSQLTILAGPNSFGAMHAPITHAAWDSAGKRVVISSANDVVEIWDVENRQQEVLLRGHTDLVLHATWSSDSRRILTASLDGTARIWNAETGIEEVALRGHHGGLSGAIWLPNGSDIITAGTDGTARIWDPKGGTELPVIIDNMFDFPVEQTIWDKTGTRLILFNSSSHVVPVWNANSGVVQVTLSGHRDLIQHVTWSPEGTRIATASADGTVRIWNADSGKELAMYSCDMQPVVYNAWRPDGVYIATASADRMLCIWDTQSGEQVAAIKGVVREEVTHMAWSPDGTDLLIGARDGSVHVWDTETITEIATLSGHTDAVKYASWHPSGRRILTVGQQGTTRVWSLEDTADLIVLGDQSKAVSSAEWSPDGIHIVTANWDGSARIWDAETGSQIATLTGHTGRVRYATWSPNGDRIATASADNTARLWDAESGEELAILIGHDKGKNFSGVTHVVWNSAGTRVVTSGYDGTARQFYTLVDDLLKVSCQQAVRNMSHDEWRQYFHDENYRKTCPDKPIWDDRSSITQSRNDLVMVTR